MILSTSRLLVLGIGVVVVAACTTASPTVQLPSGGTVTGVPQTNVAGQLINSFRGIPYTDAPVGEKRWRQSKLKPLIADIDATAFGSACFGDARFDPTYGQFPVSEDCLFLNVFAPASASSSSKLPVMVWIHGGAFVAGSSSQYDPKNLIAAANDELVVVTFNYRLGVLGFLSNDEIVEEGDGANFAFRDQEVAFQWVRTYIHHFGGDPSDITAFGESVGSISVAMHMISRDGGQQLFDKAIMQSGAYPVVHDIKTIAQMDEYVATVAVGTGCAGAQAHGGVVNCLRRANVSAISEAGGLLPWRPTVDGVFLHDVPIHRVLADKISRIPTLAGVNTDEGWLFTFGFPDSSQFDLFLRIIYPLLTETEYARVAALYPAAHFASPQHRVAEIFGDVAFVCPSETLSSKLATHPNVPTYRYRYNQTALVYGVPIALHTAEIDYVFNNVPALPQDENARSLVATIQRYWINFVKTGNPNGVLTDSVCDDNVWPPFNGLLQQQIVLQTDIGVETTGVYMPDHEKRCAFWRAVDLRIASEIPFRNPAAPSY